MTRDFINLLGDLLTDYLGMVLDIESNTTKGYKGIYSVKELRVMHMVFRNWRRQVPCTVTLLANETGINKTTVSRAVTSMMTNGLLKEEQDPEDGRRRLLVPTKEGIRNLQAVNEWLASWAERLHDMAGSSEPCSPPASRAGSSRLS